MSEILCEGGTPLTDGPCVRCGRLPSQSCGRPEPDKRYALLVAERDALKAENERLQAKADGSDGWTVFVDKSDGRDREIAVISRVVNGNVEILERIEVPEGFRSKALAAVEQSGEGKK